MYKGMLKGIIISLGIQYKAIYVHIFTHWMVYPGTVWFFAFYHDLGIVGIWYGKICLEYSIFILYNVIIQHSDWTQIAS